MKFFILLILLSAIALYPQEKYFIYFKDKGIPESSFSKNSAVYNEVLNNLSEHAVERRKKVMGENFIRYEDLPVNKNYVNEITSLGIKIVHELSWFNSVSAYLDDQQINKVSELNFVRKIEPVKKIIFKREEPVEAVALNKIQIDDAKYGFSFNQLKLSDVPAVHKKGITGEGIIIGFLDSGFDWQRHESLQNADVLGEYDFVFNDSVTANQAQDSPSQHSHGTNVFSVVGGYKENSFIGAAYGASFLLAKTEYIPTETHVEEDNYAAALIWMESKGVDITSSSLGYNTFDSGQGSYSYSDMNGNTTIVTRAVEKAFERGIVTITSAGNEGSNSWKYITAPADGFNVISVGAVTNNNQLASFSSRGPTYDGRIKPEVVAQGTQVYCATASTVDKYNTNSGTSLSTPIVSGIAALLLSAYPHLTNVQVRNIFLKTSDNALSPNNERGYGLVSAARAISFPNLQKIENHFRLYKAFLDVEKFDPQTPVLHYRAGDENEIESSLVYDGNFKFTFDFPDLQYSGPIHFYFTYKDSSGIEYREPANNNFSFIYGDLNIVTSTDDLPVPENYVLAQNYPNPFNSQTTINFISSGNENAELIVIDAVGQKVATLHNSLTKKGLNTVVWDGTTENGVSASSGVYYYILKMSGKEYGRKMVLLK